MISVRPAEARDLDFIRSSWVHHMRSHKPHHVPTAIFYEGAHALMHELLERSIGFVATPNDDPDLILGAVVGERSAEPKRYSFVHWLYVKESFRGHGLAKQLADTMRNGCHAESRPVVTCQVKNKPAILSLKRRGYLVCPSLSFYLAIKGAKAA